MAVQGDRRYPIRSKRQNRTHDRLLSHGDQTISSGLSGNRGTCRRDNFGGTPRLRRTEQNGDFVQALLETRDDRSRARRASTWTACENGAYRAVFADDEIIEFMGERRNEKREFSNRERKARIYISRSPFPRPARNGSRARIARRSATTCAFVQLRVVCIRPYLSAVMFAGDLL